MKGEYVEEEFNNSSNNNNNNNNNNNMFAKLSHQPNFQTPPHPPQHHFPPPHLLARHPPPPQETDPTTAIPPSQPPQNPTPLSKKPKTTTPPTTQPTTSNEDLTGTIELSRRPRGRPPGSKNKPKPPVIITREPDPPMSPYILELHGGADIVESLTRFTRRRGVGLCVLTATGVVANVTLKQPSTTTPGGTVTFHGRFDILSLSALLVVKTVNGGCGRGGNDGFTISLAGPQGQIVGGKVVGALICAGIVYVTGASFNNLTYCRLPLDHQDSQDQTQQLQQSQQPPPPQSCSNDKENSPVDGGGGGTMALYSGDHVGPTTSGAQGEVIWATPTSVRPPY